MPVYVLMSAFTIWMAVEAIRRGQASSWLWIILMFGPIGAAVYFFSEYVQVRFWRAGGAPRRVSANELRMAQADARRLDTAVVWAHLASLLRMRRQFPTAVEAASRAVERDAQNPDARYELGLAHIGAGASARAVPHLSKVVEKERFFAAGDALLALAHAEKAAGDVPSARTHFEQLAERHARPEILYALAETQAFAGDHAAARQTLERLLEDADLVPDYLRRQTRPWARKARRALDKMGAAR